VHRAALDHQEYSKFFSEPEDVPTEQAPNFVRGLERIGPEVFGLVPADGLKFFALTSAMTAWDRQSRSLPQLLNPVV